jgi:hypothetical protein
MYFIVNKPITVYALGAFCSSLKNGSCSMLCFTSFFALTLTHHLPSSLFFAGFTRAKRVYIGNSFNLASVAEVRISPEESKDLPVLHSHRWVMLKSSSSLCFLFSLLSSSLFFSFFICVSLSPSFWFLAPVVLARGTYCIIAEGFDGNGKRSLHLLPFLLILVSLSFSFSLFPRFPLCTDKNGNQGSQTGLASYSVDLADNAIEFSGLGCYGNANAWPSTRDGGPANRYAAGSFAYLVNKS